VILFSVWENTPVRCEPNQNDDFTNSNGPVAAIVSNLYSAIESANLASAIFYGSINISNYYSAILK